MRVRVRMRRKRDLWESWGLKRWKCFQEINLGLSIDPVSSCLIPSHALRA